MMTYTFNMWTQHIFEKPKAYACDRQKKKKTMPELRKEMRWCYDDEENDDDDDVNLFFVFCF